MAGRVLPFFYKKVKKHSGLMKKGDINPYVNPVIGY